MTVHYLKTWPVPFDAVSSGNKRYEIRQDDRDYSVGDVLVLQEWVPDIEQYTGREERFFVSYKTRGEWGLPAGLCVMSLSEYYSSDFESDLSQRKGE